MHFEGEGDPLALARAVRAAWDTLGKMSPISRILQAAGGRAGGRMGPA